MTLAIQVVLCAVLLLAGSALLVIGWLGVRGTLPPNRFFGVRTPATMRDDTAFQFGNRAGAPAMLAAGAVAVLAGASLPLLASVFSVVMIAVIGFVGAFALMTAGGVIGNRAAEALPAPEPAGGCGGCAGGCCGASQLC